MKTFYCRSEKGRRRLLKLPLLALIWGVVVSASAQGYPNRPLKLLVGAPPGGGNDIVARIVAKKLSENLGQPVVVENRPGAGATIATEVVAKAQPDGYTLLLTPSAHALSATIYPKLPYDSVRSFTAIGEIAVMPTVLIVPPTLPVNTVSDLIALAKSKCVISIFLAGERGTRGQ
jgi:tripartite-type tricarboxylate transporter receptor subunit TctC